MKDWLFAAPALLLLALINAVPVAQTLALSGEYGRLAADPTLRRVAWNTIVFSSASVTAELCLGLALALLLRRPFRGRGAARAAVLLPWALPTAVMATGWRLMLGSLPGAWLSSPAKAMAACVAADVWKTTPFIAILLMSGLAGVPEELHEAAALDGAGPVRRFFIVTLPLLKPTLALAALFRLIQAIGIFDLIYVMTGGGPGGRTRTIALYLYDCVYRYQELAYGCAVTVAMAGALALLALSLAPLGRRAR